MALEKFVSDHIVYPDSAIYYGAEGTVYVRFVVNKDGTLSDIVVMKSAVNLLEPKPSGCLA
ncbi:MAG: TonB family protein [Crocinitomicaceae bacterium]|nr:TonB family protein [Crocinitomicaceae bacterium]